MRFVSEYGRNKCVVHPFNRIMREKTNLLRDEKNILWEILEREGNLIDNMTTDRLQYREKRRCRENDGKHG